jgi:hypothetical protein
LTPVLERRRDRVVDEQREAIVEGQELLYQAIAGEESLSREATGW